MRRVSTNAVLVIVVALAWTGTHAAVAGSTVGVPPWATAVAAQLLGTNAPSVSNPHPQAITLADLAQRVYDSAIATRNFHAMGHRSVDPATGNFLGADGLPTGVNAVDPPGPASPGGATPASCSGVDDPNATCHAYGGTASSVYIDGNICYTNPTGYDGCMGETNLSPQFTYYCGPGSSRVMASNWYGPPMYNLGASPPNSTSRGYAWYENTNPSWGTYASNMPTAINNDIINHTSVNPHISLASSGSQNGFQYRVGYDMYGYSDAMITSLYTDANGWILPEWSNYPGSYSHFVTVYSYDFTNSKGAINYFDSSGPASGPPKPTRAGQYVYQFWSNVKANDNQVYIP
ncbi:MAG: hypothetical protein ACRDFX_08590 [Chloroflexota bacterium]